HVAVLVIEGLRVFLRIEVAALPAPVGPGPSETVEDLARIGFADMALGLRERGEGLLVGSRTPQPRRNVILFHLLHARGNARLAEVFLGKDVGRHLAPGGGNGDTVETEHDRTVRIADLALRRPESNGLVRRLTLFRIVPLNPHFLDLSRNKDVNIRAAPK